MPNRHAILGPSGAYRWLACTPSARFEEQITDEESVYAREGTLAHAIAEIILGNWAGHYEGREDALRMDYAHATLNAWQFYADGNIEDIDDPDAALSAMIEYCEGYASYCIDLEGVILTEREYDLSAWVPLSFGTCDCTNIHEDVLYITDLKFGKGKPVSAKGNPQLRLYALGALIWVRTQGHSPQRIVMTIYQPRVGGPSTDEISVDDLIRWAANDVQPRALLAISGQGDFIAGKHCDFCKARTLCKAYYDQFSEVMDIMDKRIMTSDDLTTVLHFGAGVASWVKKVEDKAIADLRARKRIPGFKLIAGRGNRMFKNEYEMVDTLIGLGYDTEDIFKQEIKGITAIETLLGPAQFEEVFKGQIINKEAKPKIVVDSDPAPAIDATAGDTYDNEEDLT